MGERTARNWTRRRSGVTSLWPDAGNEKARTVIGIDTFRSDWIGCGL